MTDPQEELARIATAGDMSASFQSYRAAAPGANALEELLEQVRTAPAKKPGGTPAAPATAPATPEEGEGSLAGRVASDIGRGVVETPRAIVKGVRDAVDQVAQMGEEVEAFLNLPGFKIGKGGIEIVSGEELKKLRAEGKQLELPDLAAPKSVTGSIVKSVAQFLTGMKGAGRLMQAAKIGTVGTAAKALQGAIANFAAFDPHQQRLSNLIQEIPALANPVTEYLASDPEDGAAEGRFKNALEGLGLGALTDGFVKGVRLLRKVAHTRAAAQTAGGEAIEAAGRAGLADDALRELGDAADDKLVRRAAVKEPVAGAAEPKSGPAASPARAANGDDVFINFARIDSDDDVKRVMQEMANLNRKGIAEAARGKRSFAQTKLSAEQVDAWDVLTSRRAGEPLNAEQSVAARELWVSASDRLSKLAQAAADNPSEGNLFAFRKMLSVHDMIQREVIAARTETARALGSWRIPVGSAAERLRGVVSTLDATGGPDVAREMARRIAVAARMGPRELSQVAEKMSKATTLDAVKEAWINGLLSNPTTHVANTLSNSTVMALRIGERATAARIASLLGDDASVEVGEAAAQWSGLVGGIKDAFRNAAKSARTGESGYGLGKIETARPGSVGAEAFGLSSSGWLGRGLDLTGQAIRVPGRALVAEDEFFKTLGYRMELHAQAVRQAAREVRAGAITEKGFKLRVADLIENPPENIRLSAVDSALYQTFTDTPGKFGQFLGKLSNEYTVAKVLMPFTRTPANILRFTFERTPLAPLMSGFRASIKAGGAKRDLALAQMGLGTMGMLAFADATLSGQVSGRGPVDPAERAALQREGWQPYAMKINGKWYTYNRLDPVGSLIGMAADATEAITYGQQEAMSEEDTQGLVAATVLAFAGNLVNKTYLSGLAGAVEALNDPTRAAEKWTERMAGSVVPSGVAAIERQVDPYVREVNGMIDAIRARTPGLSEKLPPRRNLWGEPLSSASGKGAAFELLSPVSTRPGGGNPIDQAIIEHGVHVTMPSRRTSFDGVTVELSPDQYSRYVELAGNELKHPAWGMGAKDFLNAVVSGKHPLSAVYNLRTDGPDGGKDVFIREKINDYRQKAREQLLREFPDLSDRVRQKKQDRRQRMMPTPA